MAAAVALAVTGALTSGTTALAAPPSLLASTSPAAAVTAPMAAPTFGIQTLTEETTTPSLSLYPITLAPHPGYTDEQVDLVYELNGDGVWRPVRTYSEYGTLSALLVDGVRAGVDYTVRLKQRGTTGGVTVDGVPSAPQGPVRAFGRLLDGRAPTAVVKGGSVTFAWDLRSVKNGQASYGAEDAFYSIDGTSFENVPAPLAGSVTIDIGHDVIGRFDLVVWDTIVDYSRSYSVQFQTAPGPEPRFTAAPTPTIRGEAAVGRMLTAIPGSWRPVADSFRYQWLRDGTPIDGATAVGYTPTPGDSGARLAVRVTGIRSGTATQTTTSAPTVRVLGSTVWAGSVDITGSRIVGQELTATTGGGWGPGPVTFTYQWYRMSAPIDGATRADYVLAAEDAGQQIGVVVTAGRPGLASISVDAGMLGSDRIRLGSFTGTKRPSVLGTATVGSTVTAGTGTWSPAPVFEYQWKRNGSIIIGATGPGYVLAAADRGTSIGVTVTARRPGYTAEWFTSTSRTIR